jgi:hypothetical protein
VVLDVHGSDHDPAHWPDPDRFDPGRFLSRVPDPDTLVPQGGGDVAFGHRCPGDGVTLTMLEVAVRTLATACDTVAGQDLDYDLSRIPTRPRSGVVHTRARRSDGGRGRPDRPACSPAGACAPVARCEGRLLVNLAGVTFISAAGIRALGAVATWCSGRDCAVHLVEVSGILRRVCGVDELLA